MLQQAALLLLVLTTGGARAQLPAGAATTTTQPATQPSGVVRTYYIAAEPIMWDYLPLGRDVCHGGGDDREHGDHDMGHQHGPEGPYEELPGNWTKAVYRGYTDATYTVPKRPMSAAELHMGLLGPAIHAEVGDTIQIVLRNKLPLPVNIEPSGVAFTSIADTAPGNTTTYTWTVPPSAGPDASSNATTRVLVYRSTSDIVSHTQAGLSGFMVIGRPGSLEFNGKPKDVDHEIFFMLEVFNEANSVFAEQNTAPRQKQIDALGDGAEDALMKMTINGYLGCNMPIPNMAVGERVRWYVGALGSEDAIHVAHWHGIALERDGHHLDQVVVQGSELYTLDSTVDNPGVWMFHCHLADHMAGGMMALFNVTGRQVQYELGGTMREYFLGVVAEEWDYAPSGTDQCSGSNKTFTEDQLVWTTPSNTTLGRKYLKARYVEFTDATFTTRKPRSAEWEHLGVNGPVIRAEVGDSIRLTLRNMLARHTISLHPHGVLYNKSSEGALYNDGTAAAAKADDAMLPGQTHVYTWQVPERAGPGPADPSSIVWLYHSHVHEAADPYAGLFGPLIITRRGAANPDATPKDVDRELVFTFMVIDETQSFMLAENIAKYTKLSVPLARLLPSNASGMEQVMRDEEVEELLASIPEVQLLVENPDFVEGNLKHSVNGRFFCNLKGMQLRQGERVRVHYMALGGTADMHTPNTLQAALNFDGHRRQSLRLLPGSFQTTDIRPMIPGPGILQCQVNDHILAGMQVLYHVSDEGLLGTEASGARREYWIQAEPVVWDYAPQRRDMCSDSEFNEDQQTYTVITNSTMGSVYKKALYRGYTNGSYTQQAQPHINGLVGPLLRAEVGDTLVVHFRNTLPFPASLQLFGGIQPGNQAARESAGHNKAPMAATGRRMLRGSGASDEFAYLAADTIYSASAVAPGQTVTYEFVVPETAGPGPADNGVVAYTYFSGVDPVGHSNAGLLGAMLVYARGAMPAAGQGPPEVPLLFNVMDENMSPFLEENKRMQAQLAAKQGEVIVFDPEAEDFEESNLMHSVNGHVYCNGAKPWVPVNGTVRFAVMGSGTETGMHAPIFTAQEVTMAGHSIYSSGLMPAVAYVLDMHATTPGEWKVYCNILDHVSAGMMGKLQVRP